jgi:hypothetical protein
MKRVAAAVVGAAAVSAAIVAPAPGYDAWSWLLWGREVAAGGLSTIDGPAFKPLPVGVCALLAPLGAPSAWVLVVRAGAAAALWLAFRLGRGVGGVLGGALAAAAMAMTGGFAMQAAVGGEAPLVVAFALGGLELWRAGRLRGALLCGAACALLRVEAWPFLAAAAVPAWRRGERGLVIALALAVPALWFVPEWIGSGDPLRSGARARVPNPGQPALADVPALASLEAAARLALWPLLAGGLLVVRRPLARVVLAAGAAWVALVALMAQAGFSGEPRYALPGVALMSAAAAAGLASTSYRPRPGGVCTTLTTVFVVNVVHPRPATYRYDVVALVAAALTLAAISAAPRVAELADIRAAQRHQWALAQDLDRAVAAAGGRRAVLACGRPYVGPYRGPLMAYALDVTKQSVEPDDPPRPPGMVFRARLTPRSTPAPAASGTFAEVARTGRWEVLARCD